MIVLDSNLRSLECKLDVSASLNHVQAVVTFRDENLQGTLSKGGSYLTTLTSSAGFVICPIPVTGYVRNIESIHIHNRTAGTVIPTVSMDESGGAEYTMVEASLSTKDSLIYEHGSGWQVLRK